MTTKPSEPKPSKPFSPVITLFDPDNSPFCVRAEVGGALQWRTERHSYPDFEIRFDGPNPANDNDDEVFKGSFDDPVVIVVVNEGDFTYSVRQFPILEHLDPYDSGPFLCGIIRCEGCPTMNGDG